MKKWDHCRSNIEVNNHLGYLHNKFTNNWNPEQTIVENIEISSHQLLPNIGIATNVMPGILAQKVREFAQNVPFDNTKKILNDVDNLPLNSAYHQNQNLILDCYEKRTDSPSEWIWEHYSLDIWRLAPLSLNAFIGSPIPSFITVLEKAIRSSNLNGINFDKLKKGTWVIQRIEHGASIGIHNDLCGSRKISFVYYLTPDSWQKKDGGGLFMLDMKGKKFRRINPDFNSLVIWEVNDDPSGLHHVEQVFAPNDKPRIALVGFFDE